jgi:hypothetical protein
MSQTQHLRLIQQQPPASFHSAHSALRTVDAVMTKG